MILNSLTLHNFMSYADAQLDLSCVPVACLAGANGAGKSALLDATTWAIWEEARSSSDQLVRLGEREMWVDVRFEHEGELYRIRRSRHKQAGKSASKGQSKGTLDFQVGLNGGESWKSLTGSSVRDTQRMICELLRMDYDTFVNSAYLKQGHADQFTTRTAEKRKQVLADILGLSYFDRLQEHCKEQLRSLRQKKDWLQQSLADLPALAAQFKERELEHKDKEEQLQSCSQEKAIRDKMICQLSEKLQRLALVKHKIESAEKQLNQDKEDVEILTSQVADLDQRLAVLERLIADQVKIEKEIGDYEELKTEIEKLDRSALSLQELTKNKIEARAELSNLRNRLEYSANQSKERLQEVRAKRDKLLKDTADSARLRQDYEEYRALVAKEEGLSQKQEAFRQMTDRCLNLQQQIDQSRVHLEADSAQKIAALKELELLLASSQSLAQKKTSLEQEILTLEKLETELELTRERGQQATSAIEAITIKIEQLKRGIDENEGKIKELEACGDSTICPLCSATIVDRSAVIARYKKLIDEMNSEITRLEHQSSNLDQQRMGLRQKYKSLDERLRGRQRLDTQIGQYNERLAAIKRAEDSRTKIIAEIESLEQRLANNDYAQVERESLIALNDELHKLDFDPIFYNSVQGQIRLARSIEPRYHQLIRDLDDLARLEKELPELETSCNQLNNTLAEETYGKESRLLLEKMEEQIAELNYDGAKHAALKAKLADLLPGIDKYKELTRAQEERPALQASHQSLQARLTSKLNQINALEADLGSFQNELAGSPVLAEEFEKTQQLAQQSALAYENLARQLAVLDAQQNQLKEKLAEMDEKSKLLCQMEQSISDYSFLAEAFGKKGIQALIIENAIPEIEADANRILCRLSDNRMHVGLVTQQTNKSGNVVETLEILIADEVGTRNYELYSGGEAFKVNFAIRVALSRLLARRAGAKLETLIIDEGFGSQDDSSRERLVKAIRSVQDDFARILVITHFADVKEMFPTHILISKSNGTSKVELLS